MLGIIGNKTRVFLRDMNVSSKVIELDNYKCS